MSKHRSRSRSRAHKDTSRAQQGRTETFADAVAASPAMTAAQKALWLAVVARGDVETPADLAELRRAVGLDPA